MPVAEELGIVQSGHALAVGGVVGTLGGLVCALDVACAFDALDALDILDAAVADAVVAADVVEHHSVFVRGTSSIASFAFGAYFSLAL